MVITGWFIKLLEVLGLKKREKSVNDELRDWLDKREERYKELEKIEVEIKKLEDQLVIVKNAEGIETVTFSDTYITKAKSDVFILKRRFDAVSNQLAMCNSNILQLMLIIDGEGIDKIGQEMAAHLNKTNETVVKLEYAAGIKVMVDETVKEGQKIEFEDATVAAYSGNEKTETNTVNNKVANTKSENVDYNIR